MDNFLVTGIHEYPYLVIAFTAFLVAAVVHLSTKVDDLEYRDKGLTSDITDLRALINRHEYKIETLSDEIESLKRPADKRPEKVGKIEEDDERMDPVRIDKDDIIGYDWYPVLRRDKYIAGNLSFIKESVGEMMEVNRHWHGRFALYTRGYKDENEDEDEKRV